MKLKSTKALPYVTFNDKLDDIKGIHITAASGLKSTHDLRGNSLCVWFALLPCNKQNCLLNTFLPVCSIRLQQIGDEPMLALAWEVQLFLASLECKGKDVQLALFTREILPPERLLPCCD